MTVMAEFGRMRIVHTPKKYVKVVIKTTQQIQTKVNIETMMIEAIPILHKIKPPNQSQSQNPNL